MAINSLSGFCYKLFPIYIVHYQEVTWPKNHSLYCPHASGICFIYLFSKISFPSVTLSSSSMLNWLIFDNNWSMDKVIRKNILILVFPLGICRTDHVLSEPLFTYYWHMLFNISRTCILNISKVIFDLLLESINSKQ